jgi:hypothetical protein
MRMGTMAESRKAENARAPQNVKYAYEKTYTSVNRVLPNQAARKRGKRASPIRRTPCSGRSHAVVRAMVVRAAMALLFTGILPF